MDAKPTWHSTGIGSYPVSIEDLRQFCRLDNGDLATYTGGVTRFGRLLAILSACVLLALTPLAYATPPDPEWISGYWDDADFDDVVVFVLSLFSVPAVTVADAGPLWMPGPRVDQSDGVAVPVRFDSIVSARAPPVASSAAS